MPFRHLEVVLAEARPPAEAFDDAKRSLYLVGGIVRELWLDGDISDDADIDLTTDATPEETKAIVEPLASVLWLQGERFGTVGARIGRRDYEITTHRLESYLADSRKPRVEFATAIEEDLSRRDFTVNAMAIEISTAELVDPFSGADDLAAHRLRTPLDPEASLSDDPLRMLRAARFAAGYGLEPDPALVDAMTALADRLDIVSAERIGIEFDKLLALPDPTRGLELLADTGVLARFLPEVAPATNPESTTSLADLAALPADAELRLAALLFGVDPVLASDRVGALRHSSTRRRWTRTVLLSAQQLAAGLVVDAGSMRRWVSTSNGTVDAARAIVATLVPNGEELVARTVVLERELRAELGDLTPALTGEQVMEVLGISPGESVGEALGFLQELRYREGPLSQDEAEQRLKEWWSGR